MKICPDCLATNVQQRRETMINTKLMEIIQSAINTVSFTWTTKTECVNLQTATNLHSFLPYTMKDSSTFVACTSNKRICTLTVDTIVPQEDIKEWQTDIIGGKLPLRLSLCVYDSRCDSSINISHNKSLLSVTDSTVF